MYNVGSTREKAPVDLVAGMMMMKVVLEMMVDSVLYQHQVDDSATAPAGPNYAPVVGAVLVVGARPPLLALP